MMMFRLILCTASCLVDKEEIEERRELQSSIMPNGLLGPFTVHEIRSLFAYLLQKQ
ncbi:MAG: hypothetical protein AAF802_22330 [Planctomycetota bacterium]